MATSDYSFKLLGVAALTATASSLLTYAIFRRHHMIKPDDSIDCAAATPQRESKTVIQNASSGDQTLQPKKRLNPYDPSPRTGYLSWDDYFMAVAFLSAQRSKDPNKQVGACIVDQQQVICGIGYNGFPRGCSDSQLPWSKKAKNGDPLATKYPYVCHAEMNAILNKNNSTIAGSKMYVTMFPCNECAKLLIQAGITEIIYHEDKAQPRSETPAPGAFKLDQQYAASKRLLSLAGVTVRQHLFKQPVSLHLTNHPICPVREVVLLDESNGASAAAYHPLENGATNKEGTVVMDRASSSVNIDGEDEFVDGDDTEISPALAALLGQQGEGIPPPKALDFD